MKRKHYIVILLASLALLLGASSLCYADSHSFKGKCEYNGKQITSDFTSEDIAAAQSRMQPGDRLTYTVTYKNNSGDTTEWYMRNEVLKTLEQLKDPAENGGYTYILENEGPNGNTVLFSNDKVGGEKRDGTKYPEDMEGLLQATNATGEFFFIQELKPKQSAKTHLTVAFDGETEVNDYMDTNGSLLVQYAVEKKEPGKDKVKTVVSHVRTGDNTRILPFIILMAAALLAAMIAIYLWRRDRREDEEKGGEPV
ncbi:MAG: hypothetical protein IJ109_07525 [Firmicutes bacterium]|nr:hypothetical protein [Bacillota bacterium]